MNTNINYSYEAIRKVKNINPKKSSKKILNKYKE